MIKVSISLPNNALITFESEETAVVQEVVTAVLRDLPRDLMQAGQPVQSNGHTPGNWEDGNGAAPHPSADNGTASQVPPVVSQPQVPVESNGTHTPPTQAQSTHQPEMIPDPAPITPAPRENAPNFQEEAQEKVAEVSITDRRIAEKAALSAAADLAFIQFCQSANPVGDMRKVVVAAEGASQFLEMPSVSAEDLEDLFDRVGWLQPHNFTQTLRNAARSKFRWLERVPGRAGQYTVTPLGRETTLNT